MVEGEVLAALPSLSSVLLSLPALAAVLPLVFRVLVPLVFTAFVLLISITVSLHTNDDRMLHYRHASAQA
jgi:hypothetical protein